MTAKILNHIEVLLRVEYLFKTLDRQVRIFASLKEDHLTPFLLRSRYKFSNVHSCFFYLE